MPYRKKYVRKNNRYYRQRKKNYRKKNYQNRPVVKKSNAFTGIPDAMLIKLKYTTFFTLSGTPTGSWKFRGNSIHDPDLTGTGGQPLGHDQWEAFYEKYCVNGSKIQLQFLNDSTTAAPGNVLLNVVPMDDNVSRSYDELNSMQFNRNRMIAPVSAGQNGVYMSSYMSTRKLMGENTLDDVYESAFGTNPTREWYWHVQSDSFDGLSAHSLSCKATITYYVKLFQRVELLSS